MKEVKTYRGYFNYWKDKVLKTNYFERLTAAQVKEKEKRLMLYEGHTFIGGIVHDDKTIFIP